MKNLLMETFPTTKNKRLKIFKHQKKCFKKKLLLIYSLNFFTLFSLWLFVGHGFWLGWQYGIHHNFKDLSLLAYAPHIIFNAFLVAASTVVLFYTYIYVKKFFQDFDLILLFSMSSDDYAMLSHQESQDQDRL